MNEMEVFRIWPGSTCDHILRPGVPWFGRLVTECGIRVQRSEMKRVRKLHKELAQGHVLCKKCLKRRGL